MSSIDCAKGPYFASEAGRVPDASSVAAARVKNLVRLLVVVLGAGWLAACAESTTVRHSGLVAPNRQASLPHDRTASSVSNRPIATAKHTPFARHHAAVRGETASLGVASFYTEDQETASGEKFNTHELTAAHPTLPFGTRLRVTNLSTGRSVTVRVNDRGPYIPGRVVDLSGSAATKLGMVESGIAKVKLDVVH